MCDASKLEKVRLYSEEVYTKFVAYTFIQGTNHSRIGKIEDELANQFSIGVNNYPCNLENATHMIINYKNYANNPNHPGKEKNNKRKTWRNNQTKK